MSELSYIYGLSDPRTGKTFYVGSSIRPDDRFKQHLKGDKTTSASPTISALLADGVMPEMKILEDVTSGRGKREKYWINRLRIDGHPIVNKWGCSLYVTGDNIDTAIVDHVGMTVTIRADQHAQIVKLMDHLKLSKAEVVRMLLDLLFAPV